MYHPILRSGAQSQLKKIGTADLVIGLPTYKNPEAAAQVAQVALEGLHQYYPHLRTVLINADAGFEATVRRAVAAQVTSNGHTTRMVTGRYDGSLGQGSATAALIDAALALDARAIVILDSHTRTITPNWIAGLAHLILEDKVDLVIPRYRQWSLAEGLLNDLILYPLFRALWGQSIRYPAAFDFALSPQLATALLDEDVWETAVATFGLPTWLASYGVVGKWRIAQSALGKKVDYSPQHPARKHLSKAEIRFKTRFHDALTVLFSSAYKYQDSWKSVSGIHSLPTLTQFASEIEPEPASEQDVVWLLDKLALGWIDFRSIWQYVLTPDNLAYLEAVAALPPEQFYFPPDLWSRIIYDFLVVFNKGEADPVQIIEALFPLYQGRLAAFRQEVAGLALVGREGTVAAQAVEFEETRTYFEERWQAYQPGRRSG
jgi:hypothetical protein